VRQPNLKTSFFRKKKKKKKIANPLSVLLPCRKTGARVESFIYDVASVEGILNRDVLETHKLHTMCTLTLSHEWISSLILSFVKVDPVE
jgi:hypothetical protein